MSPLMQPDVGGGKKLCKTINQAHQFLTNDAAREA